VIFLATCYPFVNAIGFAVGFAKGMAHVWCGAKISSGGECFMRLINLGYIVVAIVDVVILIWVSLAYLKVMGINILNCFQGSVVVFNAWATWTDNYEEYASDVDYKNYCAYEPMMYAFAIILAKWVRIFFLKPNMYVNLSNLQALLPFLVVLFCVCSCLYACCCASNYV
jgi:hypothetical protein